MAGGVDSLHWQAGGCHEASDGLTQEGELLNAIKQ